MSTILDHSAILSRVTDNGLGYLVDKVTKKVLLFTFDKLPSYKGETVSQLGLKAGSPVNYALDDEGTVIAVNVITRQAKKKSTLFSW